MRFVATELTQSELDLQREVRAFLDAELPFEDREPGLGMSGGGASRAFSRLLAARGWVGMALPRQYGGGDRSAVDRFIVTEELLRRGAPVEHHWFGDRQTGPTINRFGTETQKRRFLPGICDGTLAFCIGMSEPDAGSDLASLRARATPVEGGWRLNGTKVWTTNAHIADWIVVLCRTSDAPDHHDGLSQLLVDLRSPGLSVHPIGLLDGTADFDEVVFEDVFVPEDLLLGTEGDGWTQNTSELAFERAGPERWLSPYIVVEQFLAEHGDRLGDAAITFFGEMVARWWAIRHLALSVARMIDDGRAPTAQAAMGKDLGTQLEQDVLAGLQGLVDVEPSLQSGSPFERLLARAILIGPSWTIRGGTSEILRTIIARELR